MEIQEKQRLRKKIADILRDAQQTEGEDGWLMLSRAGTALRKGGVTCKQYGYARLSRFLQEFEDILEFDEHHAAGQTPVYYLRVRPQPLAGQPSAQPQPAKNGARQKQGQPALQKQKSAGPAARKNSPPAQPAQQKQKNSQPAQPAADGPKKPDAQPKKPAQPRQTAQPNPAAAQPMQPYQLAYTAPPAPATPQPAPSPAQNTSPRTQDAVPAPAQGAPAAPQAAGDPSSSAAQKTPAPQAVQVAAPSAAPQPRPAVPPTPDAEGSNEREPTPDSWLYKWAFVHTQKLEALADLALEERWDYAGITAQGEGEYAILRSYLAYTFRRLCYEGKVCIRRDAERDEEYAAFNTGLVDRKYDYIYALFKQNARYITPYWYLLDFVVAGEDAGKTLVSLFNPLPAKADYFENKIENMFYDPSTGNLSCDYTHMLTERTGRFPQDFFYENCPTGFTKIGGMELEQAYALPENDEARRNYFFQLGQKIQQESRVFIRLKNRLDDAVKLALKRAEWNYKTAIPMYYPTRNKGSLLLPLCLMEEDRVDLALVVERQPSGAYQGQTVLPLHLAYSNSRLITRPDSDWLRTDTIVSAGDVFEEA